VLLVSPRGRPAPGDYEAWLDAGPGVACKSLAHQAAGNGVPGLIYTSDLTFPRTKAYVSRLGAALAAAADRETARCGGVLWLRPPV
jgi:hypothetical protein